MYAVGEKETSVKQTSTDFVLFVVSISIGKYVYDVHNSISCFECLIFQKRKGRAGNLFSIHL